MIWKEPNFWNHQFFVIPRLFFMLNFDYSRGNEFAHTRWLSNSVEI